MPKLSPKLAIVVTVFVLLVLTIALNPLRLISSQQDDARRQDVTLISAALATYVEENDGSHPTHHSGAVLPTVLTENILDKGVDASAIDRIDKYLNRLPKGPTGEEYKVGVNATGNILVAAKLSDGSIFVK